MCEDIYKKHISPTRSPNVCRMKLTLLSWNCMVGNVSSSTSIRSHLARIDLARTFNCCSRVLLALLELRFVGVTEENIYSILRRAAACRYKAFFVDGARVAGKEQQAAARGIFPRDPTISQLVWSHCAASGTMRGAAQPLRPEPC